MRILIVDDEKKARDTITRMLQLYCPGEGLPEEAAGVTEALQKIQVSPPDLVLLDIHLKDGTGFDLLQKAGAFDFYVIFITAFEEYAIRACKVAALDYLLKPINPDELREAIAKARKRVEKEKMLERLDAFMQNMSGAAPRIHKITLKTAESIHVVSVADIVYCEASGSYTIFHLHDGRKIMVSRALGEYEEMIGSGTFIRVHQSFLVNGDHILRYERGDGGALILTHEQPVPVSSRKKDLVLQFLNQG